MDLPQHILSVQQSEHIHQALKTCPRYFLSPQEMPLLVCSKQSEFLAPVSAWCAVSEQKTHSSILCSIITSELCKLSLEVPRWSVLCSAAAAVRSDCPGPCPVEFWIYTRIEILQALWSPPAFRHSCDLKAKKTPFICCLNGFFFASRCWSLLHTSDKPGFVLSAPSKEVIKGRNPPYCPLPL